MDKSKVHTIRNGVDIEVFKGKAKSNRLKMDLGCEL